MKPYLLVPLAILMIISYAFANISNHSTFCDKTDCTKTLRLFINSRKDVEGEWVTTYHASSYGSTLSNISLDLTQSVNLCEGCEAVHLKGLIRENNNSASVGLKFHPKCGKNAAISHDGRSVQKIKLEDPLNGVVLTQRPLRRNELFEVRLDKKHNKFQSSFGIGVTSYAPASLNIPDHMYNLKSGNWMMYHDISHINGEYDIKNYGKNLNGLEEGDRAGVMVNNYGVLHYFVNGVDQGPAASNMPKILYGVFELYYNAAKGTIVDPSP